MKYLILIFVLLFAGCNSHYDVIAIKGGGEEPIDVLRIPPGARVEWDDMTIPNHKGEMIDVPGDLFFIEQWGYYNSDPVLDKVHKIRIQEKLDPDLWDWLAQKLGLTR